MLGRRVFLVVSDLAIEAFEAEQSARSWADEHTSRAFRVYEVTGVRECTDVDYRRSLVAAKEAELVALRKRLGVD